MQSPSQSPDDLAALAFSLRRQGDFEGARQAAQRAIAARRDNASAWFNLGAALASLGSAAEAETAYREALSLQPRFAEAWSNLAGLLDSLGRQEEAISAYRQALAANDRLVPVWSNLGNTLVAAGRHAEAEQVLRTAVALDGNFAPAWVNLARLLNESGRFEDALGACQRAVDLVPGLAGAWAGMAKAFSGLRRFEAAIEACRTALRLEPGNADFHANLAVASWGAGHADSAMLSARRALELDPHHAYACFRLSGWLLGNAEYEEGWRRSESRWKRPGAPPRRYADKGAPGGRGRVLVWGEQGVGDEILYSVMADELARRGGDVTLEADERLVPLFQRSFPGVRVWPRRAAPDLDPSAFDCVVPAGSLGQCLRRSGDAFPKHRGYLVADDARTRAYRAALPQGTLVVGLAWRSSNPEVGAEKSAPLVQWHPLLAVPGVTFVNLQYGDIEAECREAGQRAGARIVRMPHLDVQRDLDGLAALQAACDLVITTSNVSAHVTGALGKAGWVLLPERIGRFWYWSHASDATPWYPSLTLMAQSADAGWASVIERAARKLRAMVSGES
jgi:tetratricopeptide (TPR) repeat protein